MLNYVHQYLQELIICLIRFFNQVASSRRVWQHFLKAQKSRLAENRSVGLHVPQNHSPQQKLPQISATFREKLRSRVEMYLAHLAATVFFRISAIFYDTFVIFLLFSFLQNLLFSNLEIYFFFVFNFVALTGSEN